MRFNLAENGRWLRLGMNIPKTVFEIRTRSIVDRYCIIMRYCFIILDSDTVIIAVVAGALGVLATL